MTSLREAPQSVVAETTDEMADNERETRQKYEEQWVPEKYLEQYYVDRIDERETNLITSLHETVENSKIKGSRGIEIGSGPTVHRMAVLARVCDEILACDYTPSNLDFLKHFLEEDDVSEQIKKSLYELARLEGYKDVSAGAMALRDRLRLKLKHIVQVDITDLNSVKNLLNYGGQFDIAHSSGVLESACFNYESYFAALKNISTILKPGAALVQSGYVGGTYYLVDDVKYHNLKWDSDFIKRGLNDAGFRIEEFKFFQNFNDVEVFADSLDTYFSVSYKM